MSGDKPQYPERWSRVEVTFIDGQVVEHNIKAGTGMAKHLTAESGRTGSLLLLCGPVVHSYPMHNVRGWTMEELDEPPALASRQKE